MGRCFDAATWRFVEPKEFGEFDLQPLADDPDVLYTDIPFTTFDPPDVAPIEADEMSERFLTDASLFPQLAHPTPEESFDVQNIGSHESILPIDDDISTDYDTTDLKYHSSPAMESHAMPSTKALSGNGARKQRTRNQEKSFCEFFAGIGLVREALSASQWECVYANDIDPKKLEIYEARFGRSEHIHLGDVWDTERVVARLGAGPFLATASFPCTDLSLAGHWRGLNGSESSAFFGFVKALEELDGRRPPMVLLENVTGFLTSRDGSDFGAATQCLAELGYWLDTVVVDAKYFVPQSRPRVFVIGVHDEYVSRIPGRLRARTLFGDEACGASAGALRPPRVKALLDRTELSTGWLNLEVRPPKEARKHVSKYIDFDDDQEWWDADAVRKHHDMMSDRHRQLVDELLASGELHIGTIYRRRRYGHMRAEVRFDGLAGCLRTPRGGSARQIVIVVDHGRLRMRWMNAREYGRLQGAESFPLLDNNIQMLYGFGDAVCVPVVKWLDEQILTPIYDAATAAKRARRGG